MPAPIDVAPIRRPTYLNKQELNLDFYEEFQPAAYHPGNDSEDKDNFYPRELEVAFCRNFSCCGLLLSDLHVLLQHYEEYHVRFEDDQALFYDDDWSSNDGSAPNSPELPSKQIHNQQNSINAMLRKKAMPSRSDFYTEEIGISHNDSSAFDTSILRSSQNVKGSKKRNHSQYTAATTLDMMTPNPKKMALPAHMASIASMTASAFPDLTMSANMSEEEFMAQTGALFMPSSHASSLADKPYKCPVPGCDKAYKNPNGLKYHNQHGHCNTQSAIDDKPSMKPYLCTIGDCGKRYKNLNGLKYHIEHAHMAALNSALGLTSPLPTPMTSPIGSPIQSPLSTPPL
ncbi:hypothetical protein BC937DRAFT_90281 [Endogone sp. FLAS-F59071]|nr:hypothetical protein BC937DRAFT_90281 [Endogone sp. FLAS-F59071]|eukprot:RUS17196.1 hypothetical protein BC937DRAFT_90281 [Endogone sp. FLAS-F59071]